MGEETAQIPQNREAERSLLGAVLFDDDLLSVPAVRLVQPADFHFESHRLIFAAMLALVAAGSGVDVVTLAAQLGASLSSAGGQAYLDTLEAAAPATAHAEQYAGLVLDASLRRRLIREARAIEATARNEQVKSEEAVSDAQRRVLDIRRPAGREAVGIRDAMRAASARWEARHEHPQDVTGVPTGLWAVDKLTSGWQPGQLVIIAGRPGDGKTSLATRSLVAAAAAGFPALLFSLEMPEEQIVDRLVAMEGRVDGSRLRSGWLRDEDWTQVGQASSRLAGLPFWIDAAPSPSLFDLRASARRVQSRIAGGHLGLVIVDYVQRMPGRGGRSRNDDVAENARGLKSLGRDMGLPVVALSQLSRDSVKQGRRPGLADLRDTGELEQEADVVLFLYHQPVNVSACGECGRGVAEVIVEKQRNGPTGIVHVRWEREFTRFHDMAPPPTRDWHQEAG